MTTIRLWNSAARGKVELKPVNPGRVGMYVCGPTVYDRAHIGNARPAVVFDVLYRLLRHVYGESNVDYVRNVTDIDDKINARAKETLRPGETPLEAIRRITDETGRWYVEDMAALGCLPPTHQPRATEYVPRMVEMIGTLVEKGAAYEAEGHVLFEVAKFPEYGRLSGRSTDDMIAGARVEVAPFKRDPMDFVLWKPSDSDQPGWESPWGKGRPGWHIECSAMAAALLGETFDIHGGGADLMFPHHENEIAQSRCACPNGEFARVWMHNGMVNVDGRKMSKSLGNFLTVADMRGQAPGEVLRLALLSTHYRDTLDWTTQRLDEAAGTYSKWAQLVAGVEPVIPQSVLDFLMDDLNTPATISEMHRLSQKNDLSELAGAFLLLGFNPMHEVTIVDFMKVLRLRVKARAEKDFAKSDYIRDTFKSYGITLNDLPNGNVKPDWDLLKVTNIERDLYKDGINIYRYVGVDRSKPHNVDKLVEAYTIYVVQKILEALR